jgi:hypothetical protein
MQRANRRSRVLKRATGDNAGFTLLEVLVAGFVLVVGLIFIASIGSITDSETRSLIHQVAAQEVEKARALDYADVGTVGGQPAGLLVASETVTVEGVPLLITREVAFAKDATYSNSGPFPANYRRVTIRVQVAGDSRLGPVELATLVAGGAKGGALDITVKDSRGYPVPDVLITVKNDHLEPKVLIASSAIRTDSTGHLLIPGLTPDSTTSYYVRVDKAGYNSDWTDPMVVVNEGYPYTIKEFIIERLSTLNIRVIDETGAAVAGASLTVTGPREFATPHPYQTDGTGFVSLADIGYSTSGNPYVVAVAAGNGYQAGSSGNIILEPGTIQDVTITVQSNGATPTTASTTATTASSTTDTTSGGTVTTASTTPPTTSPPTATTLGRGKLTVHVQRWKEHDGHLQLEGLENANVTFSFTGGQGQTNSGGDIVFSDVPFGTYDLLVTKKDYVEYRVQVTFSASPMTVTVTMVKKSGD